MVEMWSTIPYNASLVDAVDMVVSPRHIKHVKDYLSCSGMTPIVIEDNLQRAIEAENEVNPEDQEGEVSYLDLTRKGCKLYNFKQNLCERGCSGCSCTYSL